MRIFNSKELYLENTEICSKDGLILLKNIENNTLQMQKNLSRF